MSYVTETDLDRFLTSDQKTTLERSGTVIDTELEAAESYVNERLNYKYDMITEFAKTGSDRSTTLIEIIAIIAIYKLSIPFDMLDQEGKFYEQYTRVLDMLMQIERGDLLSDYLDFRNVDERTILYGKVDDNDFRY